MKIMNMADFESELHEYISDYCCDKNISIDLRFECFGDVNKFYTNDAEFSLDCVNYYTEDFEDIKKFFSDYLDVMWEKCESPMNRIALYIKDIYDMDGWYDVIVGGGLFTDETLI